MPNGFKSISARFEIQTTEGATMSFGFENAPGPKEDAGGVRAFGEYIGKQAQRQLDRLLGLDDEAERIAQLEAQIKELKEYALAKDAKAESTEEQPQQQPRPLPLRRGRPPKVLNNGDA